MFPDTCEGEGFPVIEADVIRLLGAAGPPPFVETIRRNEAAAIPEGLPKGGLFSHGLCPRIDGAIAGLRLLGPGRYEAPVQRHELPATFKRVAGSKHGLSGRDVVLRAQNEIGPRAEEFSERLNREESSEAAAHGQMIGRSIHTEQGVVQSD